MTTAYKIGDLGAGVGRNRSSSPYAPPRPRQPDPYQTGRTSGSSGVLNYNLGAGNVTPSSRFQHVDPNTGRPIPIGSANYGAYAGITNALGQMPTGPARDQYTAQLRALGIMPTINSRAIDSFAPGENLAMTRNLGFQPGAARYRLGQPGGDGKGGMNPLEPAYAESLGGAGTAQGFVAPGGAGSPTGASGGAFTYGGLGAPGASAPGALTSSLGGAGSIGSTGGLENQLSDAYSGILASGGRPYTQEQEGILGQRAADTISQGSAGAIRQARLDAIRRGDTSGSTLGDVESRISQRGAADVTRARQDVGLGNAQTGIQNLLAALGGAGGYIGDRRTAEVLLGQLAAQQGLGGVNLMLGVGRK